MVAVIGDIHGCFYTLVKLIDQLDRYYPNVPIYSVGDLVDRGNFSFEVVDFFLERKIFFTKGNHDLMFYDHFNNPESIFAYSWFSNGAMSTLRSYQDRIEKIDEHLSYIDSMPLFFNLDDCFISHAGISNRFAKLINQNVLNDDKLLLQILNQSIETDYGILWCRERLLNIGKLQVVGHTRMSEPTYDSQSNSIYIDCGAVSGNKLVSVIIENGKVVEYIWTRTELMDIM
ncbi:MAG: metallophosphoesterase [Ignavibacterium sp.]|nr:metallophosphoesterase [Ignavibacterium sp.]MCX7612310.1 metallophosphoesterase [Ignavibacterium sp.]MDW8375789.1 metallophosphoesterase [Ignavibacteriales bacterium]